MKLCTWNIWFDHKHQSERIKAAMNELQQHQHHIICLQEVTKPILNVIMNHAITREYKVLYDQYSTESYGEIFLVRRDCPVNSFYSLPFRDSNMGRRIYLLDTIIDQKQVRVLNVHLESEFTGNPNGVKARQLEQLLKFAWGANKPNQTVIIAGDTNLTERDEHWSSDMIYRLGCTDLKPPNVTLHTYDFKRNSNVLGKFQSRLDRFIGQSGTTFQEYGLVGTIPFVATTTGESVYPSDHFGVSITIQC
jgi:endonuclease/exonuclease/phosphatase family metal-dependent hydrolase